MPFYHPWRTITWCWWLSPTNERSSVVTPRVCVCVCVTIRIERNVTQKTDFLELSFLDIYIYIYISVLQSRCVKAQICTVSWGEGARRVVSCGCVSGGDRRSGSGHHPSCARLRDGMNTGRYGGG